MGTSKPREHGDAPQGAPVTVIERDNFAHAACDCGWRGPARRSRKRAREDAAEHAREACRDLRS